MEKEVKFDLMVLNMKDIGKTIKLIGKGKIINL